MFHQFGSFAQYERELISQRTKFGMIKRLKQGLWNGQAPYGYKIVKGKLVINSKEADLVEMIFNAIYAGFVRWGGEMAEGSHAPIIEKEVFDCVQDTLKQRNNQTRRLRTPNYLTGLVRCGKCNAPMHVTYPGIEPKSRVKCYVCNNRYNFQAAIRTTSERIFLRAVLTKRLKNYH